MRRRRLALALIAAGAVMVVTPVAVWAQTERFTGFYNLKAEASGIGVIFGNPSSAPYPTAAGLVPETAANLANGPTAYALSSAAWPGPLAANAGSLSNVLFPLCVPDGDGVCVPKPDDDTRGLANYPVRAEAFSPGGQREDEVGPLTASAIADDADAKATVADFDSQGIVSTGRITTRSHSFLDIGRGSAVAETVASELEIAGGTVKIASLQTIARGSTDGVRATVEREIVIEGLEIAGHAATVDEEGVRFTDGAVGPANEELLSNFGMEMFVTRPLEDTSKGGEARIHSGALAIRWKLGDSGNHVLVTIGGAGVHVQGAGSLGPPSVDVPSDLGPVPAGSVAPTLVATGPLGGSAPVIAPVAPSLGGAAPAPDVALDVARPAAFFGGIAPGWIVFAVIGAILAGLGMNRLRGAALTDDPSVVTRCPLEER